jgi:excisionase family DNA binding protein
VSISKGGPAGPTLYDVAEVAAMFKMSRMTIYRAIGSGELRAVRIRGRWLVPASVIDALVTEATSDAPTDSLFAGEPGGR